MVYGVIVLDFYATVASNSVLICYLQLEFRLL